MAPLIGLILKRYQRSILTFWYNRMNFKSPENFNALSFMGLKLREGENRQNTTFAQLGCFKFLCPTTECKGNIFTYWKLCLRRLSPLHIICTFRTIPSDKDSLQLFTCIVFNVKQQNHMPVMKTNTVRTCKCRNLSVLSKSQKKHGLICIYV